MKKIILILVIGLLFTSSCSGGSGRFDDLKKEVLARRAQWESQGIKNYIFTEVRGCFCAFSGTPFNITVVDRELSRIINSETGEEVGLDDFSFYKTVDELFTTILSEIDSGPADVQVTFDETLGYPKSVYIDPSQRIADEEIAYEVSNLVVSDAVCGNAACTNGQVCCNDSCGICTEPGGACVELFCVN